MPLSKKTRKALKESEGLPRGVKLRPRLLLTGQIPEPMHGLAPRVVLGSAWWDKTRREAYASTNYHCITCGVHKRDARFHKWLEGHEIYRINWHKGTMTYLETVPLCHACHNFVHNGRLEWLLEEGKITYIKYAAIIQHGESVLTKARIKIVDYVTKLPGDMASWDNWRLVVNGKKYKPLKTEEQAIQDLIKRSRK